MSNILFENDACMVINKRCGEDGQNPPVVRESETFPVTSNTLQLKPVHRLDTPASGCLLLAKTKDAAAFLSNALADIEKRYWAIIEKQKTANPEQDTLLINEWKEIVHWISFVPKQNKSFARAEQANSTEKTNAIKANVKKAVLRLRQLGSGDNYLFVEIDLITGRHHQIRAQLAALGFHIKGDLKYGARRSEKSGGIRLHARSLRFLNPLNPDEVVFVEAEPAPLDSLWEAFVAEAGALYSQSGL